ncbi:MAG TPA: protocatechuate 3,4-dioxygenase [Planctomycetota bacterium]|nr:protocatechuate 3,4-dioxygenase [Planctomycetota bacterium]
MSHPFSIIARRTVLTGSMACGALALFAKGAFADALEKTPALTEGPFYPDKLPLDTDNDLIIVNDSLTPAVGDVTHLAGKIMDSTGAPIRNAVIEIWQVDNNGAYLHSQTNNADKRDKNFQGYGRFLTGSDGAYYFRTIKPVAYPGRTPHIHVKVKKGREELITTQIFINGAPGNANDGVLRGVRDPLARELVIVDFTPLKDSKAGELAAKFNIVVGVTPVDDHGAKK